MNKIERQILKNQKVILRYLWLKDNDYKSADGTLLIETANETDKLLDDVKSTLSKQKIDSEGIALLEGCRKHMKSDWAKGKINEIINFYAEDRQEVPKGICRVSEEDVESIMDGTFDDKLKKKLESFNGKKNVKADLNDRQGVKDEH